MNGKANDPQTKTVLHDIDMCNINDIYVEDEWANMCEDEYDNNEKDRPLEGSLHENDNERNIRGQPKDIDVNDILLIDISKFTDNEILYYEVCITDYLKKCIDTEYKNIELLMINSKEKSDAFFDKNIINKLRWLMKISSYFSKKLKLSNYVHKINHKKYVIPRSSYKFCNNNYKCEYNYNSRYKGCIAKHFIHNMVYADINVLIKYISAKQQTYDLAEIRKSIHTISFVMNHMYDELRHGIKQYGYDKAHVNIHYSRRNKFNSSVTKRQGLNKSKFTNYSKQTYDGREALVTNPEHSFLGDAQLFAEIVPQVNNTKVRPSVLPQANNKRRYKSRKNSTRKYTSYRRRPACTRQLSTITNHAKKFHFLSKY